MSVLPITSVEADLEVPAMITADGRLALTVDLAAHQHGQHMPVLGYKAGQSDLGRTCAMSFWRSWKIGRSKL